MAVLRSDGVDLFIDGSDMWDIGAFIIALIHNNVLFEFRNGPVKDGKPTRYLTIYGAHCEEKIAKAHEEARIIAKSMGNDILFNTLVK